MFDISVTDRCHKILAKYISEGDTVIDCTAGGGADTLFLAKSVGTGGCVLAFDVQETALNVTEKLLQKNGFLCKRFVSSSQPDFSSEIKTVTKSISSSNNNASVLLIHDSHEKIGTLFSILSNNAPSVIMYNLGYLPGGDHSIVTKAETTLNAIRASLDVIKENGIISIVTYPGHEEGARENQLINKLLSYLPPDRFEVLTIDQTNRINAPVLCLINKKR
ncbi:MAG: class I SAM-dependent methyltransferase [Anaerovoracaceae bacterium]|nr:class I SAM-dependent methyltransferase [Anaerovoracaceae bacterium]